MNRNWHTGVSIRHGVNEIHDSDRTKGSSSLEQSIVHAEISPGVLRLFQICTAPGTRKRPGKPVGYTHDDVPGPWDSTSYGVLRGPVRLTYGLGLRLAQISLRTSGLKCARTRDSIYLPTDGGRRGYEEVAEGGYSTMSGYVREPMENIFTLGSPRIASRYSPPCPC